jgi:hypothetical protein
MLSARLLRAQGERALSGLHLRRLRLPQVSISHVDRIHLPNPLLLAIPLRLIP